MVPEEIVKAFWGRLAIAALCKFAYRTPVRHLLKRSSYTVRVSHTAPKTRKERWWAQTEAQTFSPWIEFVVDYHPGHIEELRGSWPSHPKPVHFALFYPTSPLSEVLPHAAHFTRLVATLSTYLLLLLIHCSSSPCWWAANTAATVTADWRCASHKQAKQCTSLQALPTLWPCGSP